MNFYAGNEQAFLKRLTAIVEANLNNEQFGVNDLAAKMRLSRSQIHRKLKFSCNKSVSQFIREIRLEKAKEFLEEGEFTVSEVAWKVGFGSPSYFIKSFHDYFGFSPGKISRGEPNPDNSIKENHSGKKRLKAIAFSSVSVLVIAILLFLVFQPLSPQKSDSKISIAVLPASCDQPDTCQFTILNQIIQNVINNLRLVNEIDAKPWTSLHQYSNSEKPIQEIAQEQHVNYIVETQVTNVLQEKIQLNVNLIEGHRNIQISTNPVNMDYTNAAKTVQDVTKVLLKHLKVNITPQIYKKINKVITENPEALRLYWDGMDHFNQWLWNENISDENLKQAINLFEEAIQYDDQFVSAYAQLAITFYKMKEAGIDDVTLSKKIEANTTLAFSLDSLNDLSLLSKAYHNLNKGEDERAVFYFESALEYNPNSLMGLRELVYIFRGCTTCELVNYEKQLEYALRGIYSEIPANSRYRITKYDYYNLGLTFRRLGFSERALFYFNKALFLESNYLPAIFEKSQIIADMKGYQYSIEILKDCIRRDSTFDIAVNHLWLEYYLIRNFDSAYYYLVRAEKILNESSLQWHAGRISLMYSKTNNEGKAKLWKEKYFIYANNYQSSHKKILLILYYSLDGDFQNVIRRMKILSNEGNYPYWYLRVFKDDPIFDDIRSNKKFKRIYSKMERNFWKDHNRIKANLEKKGLL